ncbi:hypothetical protein [Streptomyces sp. NPDC002132]|uniref:hypothetical protein n=1 Tax=unclassified Streptomyces TaxID=2593676 RepID=UPI00331DDA78
MQVSIRTDWTASFLGQWFGDDDEAANVDRCLRNQGMALSVWASVAAMTCVARMVPCRISTRKPPSGRRCNAMVAAAVALHRCAPGGIDAVEWMPSTEPAPT